MRRLRDRSIAMRAAAGRPGLRGIAAVLATAALVGAFAVPVATGAGPAAPRAAGKGATAERRSCAPLARAARNATGDDRAPARRRLAACKAENAANARALRKVRGGRYVGQRGDGQVVDWTFCADGNYVLRDTSGGSTGVSTGRSWRITDGRGRTASSFTAYVADPKEGTEVGISLRGGAWKVGVSRSFGEIESLGPVTRTDATAACGELAAAP